MFWFAREIHEFRRAGLHAVSHLVGLNARERFGIVMVREGKFVETFQSIERGALRVVIEAFRIRKIKNGIATAAERNAGVNGRQKTAAPIARAAAGAVARTEHDVTRQVFRFSAEAVERPCAEA